MELREIAGLFAARPARVGNRSSEAAEKSDKHLSLQPQFPDYGKHPLTDYLIDILRFSKVTYGSQPVKNPLMAAGLRNAGYCLVSLYASANFLQEEFGKGPSFSLGLGGGIGAASLSMFYGVMAWRLLTEHYAYLYRPQQQGSQQDNRQSA